MYGWSGLSGGHVRCPALGNRQLDMDIATETQLCTEYLTTYFYTWSHSHPSATLYLISYPYTAEHWHTCPYTIFSIAIICYVSLTGSCEFTPFDWRVATDMKSNNYSQLPTMPPKRIQRGQLGMPKMRASMESVGASLGQFTPIRMGHILVFPPEEINVEDPNETHNQEETRDLDDKDEDKAEEDSALPEIEDNHRGEDILSKLTEDDQKETPEQNRMLLKLLFEREADWNEQRTWMLSELDRCRTTYKLEHPSNLSKIFKMVDPLRTCGRAKELDKFLETLPSNFPCHKHWILVLSTRPGNLPAVGVWITKMVQFASRPVQKPQLLLLGEPNSDPYPSTLGYRRVWLDPSVPNSGSGIRVVLFTVSFRYPTDNCKIFTSVHHCLCLMYWLPL